MNDTDADKMKRYAEEPGQVFFEEFYKDRAVRLKVLYMATWPEWYEAFYHHSIKPEYMRTDEEADYLKAVYDYQEKYGTPPDLSDLQYLKKYNVETAQEMYEDLIADIVELADAPEEAVMFTADRIQEYARQQSIASELAMILNKPLTELRAEDIEERMKQAKLIGMGDSDWEVSYISGADALEYTPENRKYIVDGLLPLRTLNFWYGREGSLKTMLLYDMIVCRAMGKTWLESDEEGIITFNTHPGHTLIIDMDNGRDYILERLRALARKHGATSEQMATIHIYSNPRPQFYANHNDSIAKVIRIVDRLGADLVVIDALLDCADVTSENDSKMGEVMSGLRRIAEDTIPGPSVNAIGHSRKDDDVFRGHSSIVQKLDFSYLCKRKSINIDMLAVENKKHRGYLPPTFYANFEYKHIPDTVYLDYARFTGGTEVTYDDKQQLADRSSKKEDEAKQWLKDNSYCVLGSSISEIIAAFKSSADIDVGENNIKGALTTLINDEFYADPDAGKRGVKHSIQKGPKFFTPQSVAIEKSMKDTTLRAKRGEFDE